MFLESIGHICFIMTARILSHALFCHKRNLFWEERIIDTKVKSNSQYHFRRDHSTTTRNRFDEPFNQNRRKSKQESDAHLHNSLIISQYLHSTNTLQIALQVHQYTSPTLQNRTPQNEPKPTRMSEHSSYGIPKIITIPSPTQALKNGIAGKHSLSR